jgi:uncharacterized membrane protein
MNPGCIICLVIIGIVTGSFFITTETISKLFLNKTFKNSVTIVLLVALIYFIYQLFKGDKDPPTPSKFRQCSIEEYERQKEITTQRELQKLKNSPQYKKFIEKTGEAQQNHCWQMRQEKSEDDDKDDDLNDDEN